MNNGIFADFGDLRDGKNHFVAHSPLPFKKKLCFKSWTIQRFIHWTIIALLRYNIDV